MKANFWQILGVVLVVGALIGLAWEKGYFGNTPKATDTTTTQPSQ